MGSTNYKIKQGDTLSGIAKKYGTTVEELATTNAIADANKIYAGDTIKIPFPGDDGTKLDVSSATITDGKSGSSNTKEEDTGFKYTPFEYGDYTEGDSVKESKTKKDEAEKALDNYGDFSYKNQAGLDEIMQKILNREDFSYDFNADALYQQYKDKYIKQGKMAMQDTIGQASAMTGGYGNSYAASVGNQAYQASLENLNDVIPELYQMAYDRYNQEGQEMLNQYGLLSDDYSREYGEWTEGYNRLDNDRSYYGTQYDNERSWDYGKWSDDRGFKQGVHDTEQGYLYQDHRDKIADNQWQQGFDYQKEQDRIANEQWERSFAETQRQHNDTMAFNREQARKSSSGSGGSSGGGSGSGSGGGADPIEPTSTSNTTDFIGEVRTKSEYLMHHNLAEWNQYIEGKIAEWDSKLTDGEIAYLIHYFGLDVDSPSKGNGITIDVDKLF